MAREKKTAPAAAELPELTAKKQEFVRLLLNGLTATDAYVKAFKPGSTNPTTLWSAASRHANAPDVKLWLAAAREAHLDQAVYTHENYISDIRADIEEAKRAGNYGAAATLRGLLGKANAFLTDVSLRKDERTSLTEELKRVEQINPQIAEMFGAMLGLTVEGKEIAAIEHDPNEVVKH